MGRRAGLRGDGEEGSGGRWEDGRVEGKMGRRAGFKGR